MKSSLTLANSIRNITENKKIVIFGAGTRGNEAKKIFEDNDLMISFFCDNNEKLHGDFIQGIKCISIYELAAIKDDVFVFICLQNASSCCQIKAVLDDIGIRNMSISESNDYEIFRFINNYLNEKTTSIAPLGHFYSPYPDLSKIHKSNRYVFTENQEILEINLNIEEQLEIFNKMSDLFDDMPTWEDGPSKYRYGIKNNAFPLGDAIVLHCMIRLIKPSKIIEVGSGWSSAVTLDTNEFYLNNSVDITFIEPYPNLLNSIKKESDNISLIVSDLQDVDTSLFEELNAGDILFIDSTHVSKMDSDVNYLFFEILPRLKNGVYIHLHDIFYPFEYPIAWVQKGIAWQELYLLRAFLQNNNNYSIVYFQNMIEIKYPDLQKRKLKLEHPLHGGSFWFRKNIVS